MDMSLTSDSIYIKAQPLQWSPDFYGGRSQPGDRRRHAGRADRERRSRAARTPSKSNYKVTHLGSDLHGTGGQGFPALYTNRDYNRFVFYNGAAPWTSGGLSVIQFPDIGLPNPPVFATERWGALVDTQNMGLTRVCAFHGSALHRIHLVRSDFGWRSRAPPQLDQQSWVGAGG